MANLTRIFYKFFRKIEDKSHYIKSILSLFNTRAFNYSLEKWLCIKIEVLNLFIVKLYIYIWIINTLIWGNIYN